MESKKSSAVENGVIMWNFLLKELDNGVLVQILKHLDIFESTSAVQRFTEALTKANTVQPVWETLDFSMLKSEFVKTTSEPFVWVNSGSDNTLYNLLFGALKLSQGKIKTLIFHYNLYLTNDQFIHMAVRCPLVRRLVFVSWNRIKRMGIRKAIRGWKDLESMTMPGIYNPRYVFEEISKHCKNFRELKVMGCIGIQFSYALTKCLPNLKVLSLRCSGLSKRALILILNKLKHLEVLNISHSCHVELVPDPYYEIEEYKFTGNIDPIIIEKASRLREFHTCMEESCIMCKRTRDDDGLVRWFKYEEGIWKHDEVSSLEL